MQHKRGREKILKRDNPYVEFLKKNKSNAGKKNRKGKKVFQAKAKELAML